GGRVVIRGPRAAPRRLRVVRGFAAKIIFGLPVRIAGWREVLRQIAKKRGARVRPPSLARRGGACNVHAPQKAGQGRQWFTARDLSRKTVDSDAFRRPSMKFRNILGLASAAAISLGLATGALAEDKVVKIGGIFPMSGNAASAGVHAKAAIEVALDIINNAH